MTVLNVKIEPPLAEFIEGLVDEGRYGSADEAVAAILADRAASEAETPEQVAQLRAVLATRAEELAAGDVVDFDMGDIYREALSRAERR